MSDVLPRQEKHMPLLLVEKKQQTRRSRRLRHHRPTIPIQVPVLNSSSNDSSHQGNDFYTWVNGDWISSANIPESESDYGISEEVEDIIYTRMLDCIAHPGKFTPITQLKESCLHPHESSIALLRTMVQSVNCVRTKEDVMEHFAILSKSSMSSIVQFRYTTILHTIVFAINPTFPSLQLPHYESPAIMHCYKEMLTKLGELLDVPLLHTVIPFEKTLAQRCDAYSTMTDYSIRGMDLCKKFPKIPWGKLFAHGPEDWKTMTIRYNSPKWIRHLGRLLEEVPIDSWKLCLQRAYILSSIQFLPAPYNDIYFEFFGRCIQGQKVKESRMKTLVNILYDYCPDMASELYWKRHGDPAILADVTGMCKRLKTAAVARIHSTEWMQRATRLAAIEKVRAMKVSAICPPAWPTYTPFHLSTSNLLENIVSLGNKMTDKLFSRIGHRYRFWEEGVYRVNAYYFNENNEIMIPFGTAHSPFYIAGGSAAWNYGALGAVIGHEMCHGFDVDGKEYDWKGEKRKWWTRRDNLAYNHKAKEIVRLYSKCVILGKRIDGKLTLAENIADIGGVAISLEALKEELAKKGSSSSPCADIMQAYREFFMAYATSWRMRYRDKKLASSIGIDSHAPASLRVNNVVCQFDEWYAAFNIGPDSELYRKPADRLRIF